MADRFDGLMTDMAAQADKAVDYQAMREAVLLEAKRRSKARTTLVRSLATAAVFLLIAGAGVTAILSPGGSKNSSAPDMGVAALQEAPAPEAAPAAAAYVEEELSDLAADESVMPPSCVPETCAEPTAEEPAEDAYSGGAGAVPRAAEDPAETASRLMLLSSGAHYTIGEPNFESCASICGYGREVLGDCAYTTLPCDAPVMEIGDVYITSRGVYDGGEGLIGLWQISETEYVLIECGLSDFTPEELVDILKGMAKPAQ